MSLEQLQEQLKLILSDIYYQLDIALGLDGKGEIIPSSRGGLGVDASGFSGLVRISSGDGVDTTVGTGLQVASNVLKIKNQAAEADVAAVSSITAGAGTDHLDLAAFNTALGTMVTEINAIRTKLNNLLAILRLTEAIGT